MLFSILLAVTIVCTILYELTISSNAFQIKYRSTTELSREKFKRNSLCNGLTFPVLSVESCEWKGIFSFKSVTQGGNITGRVAYAHMCMFCMFHGYVAHVQPSFTRGASDRPAFYAFTCLCAIPWARRRRMRDKTDKNSTTRRFQRIRGDELHAIRISSNIDRLAYRALNF